MLAGFVAIAGIEYLGHNIFPLPEEVDMTDMANVEMYLENAPIGAMLMVIVAHLLGGLAAVFTALKVGKTSWGAYIVSALYFLATIANLFMIPHPTWFTVADVVAILAAIVVVFKFTPQQKAQ